MKYPFLIVFFLSYLLNSASFAEEAVSEKSIAAKKLVYEIHRALLEKDVDFLRSKSNEPEVWMTTQNEVEMKAIYERLIPLPDCFESCISKFYSLREIDPLSIKQGSGTRHFIYIDSRDIKDKEDSGVFLTYLGRIELLIDMRNSSLQIVVNTVLGVDIPFKPLRLIRPIIGAPCG